MTPLHQGSGGEAGGHAFESWIVAFCDRFLAQRTFELVVAPALADCEFEAGLGRQTRLASRVAILRAVAGGWLHDAGRASGSFAKLALISMSYFMTPLVMGGGIFKTWDDFLAAMFGMFVLSIVPVIFCFWPDRHTPRPSE